MTKQEILNDLGRLDRERAGRIIDSYTKKFPNSQNELAWMFWDLDKFVRCAWDSGGLKAFWRERYDKCHILSAENVTFFALFEYLGWTYCRDNDELGLI